MPADCSLNKGKDGGGGSGEQGWRTGESTRLPYVGRARKVPSRLAGQVTFKARCTWAIVQTVIFERNHYLRGAKSGLGQGKCESFLPKEQAGVLGFLSSPVWFELVVVSLFYLKRFLSGSLLFVAPKKGRTCTYSKQGLY